LPYDFGNNWAEPKGAEGMTKESVVKTLVPILILIGVVWTGLSASGQQKPRTKTKVDASDCDDPVGNQFAFHLRETLRKSAGYIDDDNGTLVIALSCLDPGGPDEPKGLALAISVLVTVPYGGSWSKCPPTGIVLHTIIYVGNAKTELMATRLLANIDTALHR
jgi:hypothetical protein